MVFRAGINNSTFNMKSFISKCLCCAIMLFPIQRPKAHLAGVLICVGVVAVGMATVVIVVKSCAPKYYCVSSVESKAQWCTATTRKEIDLDDELKYIAGPYSSEAACTDRCNQTNAPTSLQAATGEYVTIEKSHDLKTWLVAGVAEGTIINFEWSETNAVSDKPVFFRVRY